MTASTTELPRIRPGLVIRCTGEGEYVVKCPADGSYFQTGEVEQFLLSQLDGSDSTDAICEAFEQRF